MTDDEGGPMSSAQELQRRLQVLSDGQQRVERYLAGRLGVDHAGLMVMNVLIGDGPRTPTELARGLGTSTAAMSLVLNRLEDAGHADRRRHPTDGRKLVVSADPKSETATLDLLQPLLDGIGRIDADLSAPDRAVVHTFLDRLTALYAAVADGGRPESTGR